MGQTQSIIPPCANCGHANLHTSPAGDVADGCNEPGCNCGYYAPTQNISDERLAEIIDAGTNCFKICVPAEGEKLARELTTLRFIHKRLVDLCTEHIDALDSGYDVLAWTAMDCIRDALAESRKLEGK